MTKRSEAQHRKLEAQNWMMAQVLNKSLSRKTGRLDRVAKSLVATKAGAVMPDPDLNHA